jgi:hypothetical protein
MYLVINKCVTAVKVWNFSGHYLMAHCREVALKEAIDMSQESVCNCDNEVNCEKGIYALYAVILDKL